MDPLKRLPVLPAALLLILGCASVAAATAPEWQDPSQLHAGVEPPSATLTVFADAAAAQPRTVPAPPFSNR